MSKQRDLARVFSPIYQTPYTNLLVSGCSYTWNNSEEHLCTWPYYLRDLAQFDTVLDCSQPGSGCNHTFNSIINEIETNATISPDNTLVIIMWSGLERVDITASVDVVKSWSNMETHLYNNQLSSLRIGSMKSDLKTWSGQQPDKNVTLLCQQYLTLIDSNAQVFDSFIKIISLANYLANLNFKFVFLEWDSTVDKRILTDPKLGIRYQQLMANLLTLGEYASINKMRIPHDHHPSPDAHFNWTRDVLLPYLTKNNLVVLN